jgi:hypothetical protein
VAAWLEASVVTQKAGKSMTAIEKVGKCPLLRSVIHREFSGAISSEFQEHISLPDRRPQTGGGQPL